MKISAAAHSFLSDALSDEESFIRVGLITVGGACSAKMVLGVSIDEDFNDEDDLRMMIDGLPVTITKQLNETVKDICLDFDPAKGVTISHS